MGDDPERYATAIDECESGKGGEFAVGERLGRIRPELALDRPVRAIPRLGYEINAFIGGWQVQMLFYFCGYFRRAAPDVFELDAVFGVGLKIELGESFEEITGGAIPETLE